MQNKTKQCYFSLFVLFFITYGYFFQGGGWNQNSRVCLIRAILHHHTFAIDQYKEDSKNPYFEFVNTGDWSYYKGHYYTNKSPGLSFMTVVPFGIAEYFLNYIYPSDTEKRVHISAYISTLCTTVLLSTLLCLLLFYVCSHFLRFDGISCLTLALFFGFGTLVFSYSTTFYGHLPAAFFSFLSFVLAIHIKCDDSRGKKSMALFSGFSAAVAVLVEPSTVITLGCIIVYLVSFKEGRRCVPFYLMGCIPPGILQCFYNTLCFGGPLSSSYNYANDAVMVKVNGKLFGLPHPQEFIQLLFLPYRGLFVSSPVLLMFLPGIFVFFKKSCWRAEAIICTIISIIFILFIASFYAWHGGSSVGPRYLLPAFPFAFFLTVFTLEKYPKTFKLLGFISILINLSITLIGNEIPRNIENPLYDFILKNLVTGKVSVNPMPFSNFENYPIETLSEMGKWTQNFNSFNLGEIIFPHSPASILPLICFWIILGNLFWRRFLKQV